MTVGQRVEALYADLRLDIYRYALTLGLSPESAQEATQEAFLRLYEALRNGTSIANTRAWLLRVVHNLALNLRQAASARVEALGPECEDLASPQNPEQQYIHDDQMQRLHKAVAELSEQQRACLELRAQGLRYREIAEVLGIAPSSASEFLRRAVERLRRILDA